MILPSKHIPQDQALIGVGASMLAAIDSPQTVSALWDRTRALPNVGTYERFVLVLSLLFIIGAIELDSGLIRKVSK